MNPADLNRPHPWVRAGMLLGAIVTAGAALGVWKYTAIREAQAAAANQPEPIES